ncbi:MAG: TIM barrel protein [Rhizobiaceae bacterium]|nr:TIM barrel protein [Rhizobiaceae bacterium]
MPRFSANLGFLWADLALPERLERAAAAGFRAVEMHWPYDTPAADVRVDCARLGLTLLGVNTPPGRDGEFGLAAVPGREPEFRGGFDTALAWCNGSGATMLHVMAGLNRPGREADARRTLLANLDRAAERAAQAGITLLLEAINRFDRPHYFYHGVDEVAAVIADLGRPNMRMMFDCYHVGIGEGDVIRRFERHLPLIGHVQIAAVPSRAEPDEGEIAYDRVLAAIDAAGYAGWIGCEYRPRTTVEAGLGWMRSYSPRR